MRTLCDRESFYTDQFGTCEDSFLIMVFLTHSTNLNFGKIWIYGPTRYYVHFYTEDDAEGRIYDPVLAGFV
jgi:hypothetical protein